MRLQSAANQMRNNDLTTQQINLMMRRTIHLEQAVLVLGDHVGRLVNEQD
jgi:hypothetical protein